MKPVQLLLIILFAFLISGCAKDPGEIYKKAYSEFSEGIISKDDFHKELIDFISTETFTERNIRFQDTAVYKVTGNRIELLHPWNFTITIENKTSRLSAAACETLQSIVFSHNNGIMVFNNRGNQIGSFNIEPDSDKTINGGTPFAEGALFYMNNQLHVFDPSTGSTRLFRDSKFTPHYKDYFNVQLIDTEKILYIVYGSVGLYKITAINLPDDLLIFGGEKAASFRVYADSDKIYYIDGAIGKWRLTKKEISPDKKSTLRSFTDIKEILLFEKGYVYQTSEGAFIAEYEDEEPLKIPFEWRLTGKYKNNLVFRKGDETIMADYNRIFEAFEIAGDLSEDS